MFEDDFGIIDRDSFFKDPPKSEDLSQEVDSTIEKYKNNLTEEYNEERLREILLELMLLEKKCRKNYDGESNTRLCCFILEMLYKYRDFDNLNYYLILLSKKREQLKATITGMINLAKSWLDEVTDREVKLNMYSTLNMITSGKIYLESQRAEIIFSLAKLKENEGNLTEANKILQDIEVETFGCLSKLEKINYILEQMRVQLMNEDYIRFYITSKKINEKLLDSDDYDSQKLLYYEYMIKYYKHENNIYQTAMSHYNRYNTLHKLYTNSTEGEENVDESKVLEKYDYLKELEYFLLYLLLSPYNEDNYNFMVKTNEDEKKNMKKITLVTEFFRQFLSNFLINLPLETELQNKMNSLLEEKYLTLLNDRVIQHNIKIISKYYTKITLNRLSQLLNIDTHKLEDEISNMVYLNNIYAKIDRPSGVVKFGKKMQPEVVLNKWVNNISKLMDLVDQCSRLVQKEKMVHEARAKQVELDSQFFS